MSKWGSNGAPMHLSYLSSDPSSKRSGTLTLLMPPTSLCYGQEYCRGGCVGLPFIVVVLMICIINIHGVIRLAGNPTLDLQRKYFTMIYMTVRRLALYLAIICPPCPSSHLGLSCRTRSRPYHSRRRCLGPNRFCTWLPRIASPPPSFIACSRP
jgi:hypothetical protein